LSVVSRSGLVVTQMFIGLQIAPPMLPSNRLCEYLRLASSFGTMLISNPRPGNSSATNTKASNTTRYLSPFQSHMMRSFTRRKRCSRNTTPIRQSQNESRWLSWILLPVFQGKHCAKQRIVIADSYRIAAWSCHGNGSSASAKNTMSSVSSMPHTIWVSYRLI
jgi:hypothetical protein